MNEKEFNKKLKESMDSPRDIPFDESAWATLETALDKEQKEKKSFFGWWLIPLFLGLGVTAWNIGLQQRVQSMKQKINTLESALTKVESEINNSEKHQNDNIVYLKDTIYRYLPPSQSSNASNYSTPLNTYNAPKNTFSKSFNTTSNTVVSPLNTVSSTNITTETEPKATLPTINKPKIEPITLDLLPPFAIVPLEYENEIEGIDTANYAYANNASDNLEKRFALKPIQIQAGVTSGGFYQPNLVNSSLRGNLQGITAKINFGENVRLLTGAEWITAQYESNDPTVLSNYKNDIQFQSQSNTNIYAFGLDTAFLVSVSNNERVLQIPLGLEFAFFKKKNLRPSINGGFMLIRSFNDRSSVDLDYSARNISNISIPSNIGEGFDYTLQAQQEIDIAIPIFVGLGIEYNINKKWQLGINSRVTFRNNSLNNPNSANATMDQAFGNSYFNKQIFTNSQSVLGLNGTLLYTF